MSDSVTDALQIVWRQPAYRGCYYCHVTGKGYIWLTLRRQLRGLNTCTAGWYRRWQARDILEELYYDVVENIAGPMYSPIRMLAIIMEHQENNMVR